MTKYKSSSPTRTLEIGYNLGKMLKPDDVVCLSGDLGTGKTLFTMGIAKSLGITEYVTSPTFTIVNEYDSSPPLYHFDVYRVADSDEILDIGFDDYLSRGGITIIEWAELIHDIIPKNHIKVQLVKDNMNQFESREILVDFIGDKFKNITIEL